MRAGAGAVGPSATSLVTGCAKMNGKSLLMRRARSRLRAESQFVLLDLFTLFISSVGLAA